MADIHTLDPERAMQALKDGTIQVLKDTLPIEGRTRILRATNVYAGPNVHIDDIHAQKRARVRNRTWAVPILADMELVDKASGKVVSKTKGVRLLNLPHYTRRYSFIVDGTEYQADNQWRLKAGAYTRMKANGGLETQFNLSKGRGFRVSFDPKKRQFLATHGTTNTPLVPLLQTLGISAEEMETAWGPEVYQTAARLQRKGQMAKLAKTLNPRSEATTPEEVEAVVRESFAATEIRPDTTSVTLGKGFTTVTGEAMLLAANKLLGVSRGTAEVDNRDSLRFKELWTVADHLPERIKNSRRRVERKIRNNLDRRDDIRKIVTPDVFNVPVKSFFTSTSLSQRPSQLNPVDMIGGHLKATLMGTGGISTENAVSHSAKMLDSSQMGFTDPFHSPEGTRSGITTHLTLGVSKRGNEPVIKVWDVKNSKWADVSPTELHGKTLAFPDQYDTTDGKSFKPRKDLITVIRGGEGDPTNVQPSEVDYVLRSPKAMFSFTANLIPFLPSDQANRAGMAARHMEQTVPLKDPEEPLLQVASGSDKPAWDTWEKILGQMQSHASPVSGTVKSVEAERIVVAGDDGKKHVVQLYDNYPLNDSKAFITSKPLVQKGDEVKKDDVIADTNFTTGGVLSMGTNLRVGYLAYKGLNYEDGITISATAAKKLTSTHLHKPRVYLDTGMMMGLKKFRANFPGVVSDANAAKLDEDGVIKRGEIIRPGDVIATVLKEADPSAEQIMLKGIHKSLAKPYRDRSLTWDKPYTGVVTEVVRNGKEVVAYVKTDEEADVGDKLTSRHGNKGVVVAILPDEEMPRDGDGVALDIVLNPSGVPGRINPGQVLENAITLAAVEDGKPYAVSNFDGDEGHRISVGDVSTKIVQVKGHYRTIKSEKGSKRIWIEPYEYEVGYKGLIDQILERKGLSETTELFDPETGKSLGPVMTGHQYILKQEHQIDKKLSARAHGYGHAYNANMVPRGTYGGNDGAQRFGELGLYAMIAHGSVNNIRDASSWKSDRSQDEIWTAIQTGQMLPAPRPSFAYEKFLGYLNGLGVNVEKHGNELVVLPMTDKQITEMSSGALEDGGKVVRGKDLRPEKGGLFDEEITGGVGGKNWSHLVLAESMPNPLFEKGIRSLLGITGKQYDGILAGKVSLDKDGKVTEEEGATGPAAIAAALAGVEVDKELATAKEDIKTARRSDLDRVNKKIKYLLMLNKTGLSAREAYVLENLPVVPPQFRPISVMEAGDLNVDGLNLLYRDVSLLSDQLKAAKGVLPDAELFKLRTELYSAVEALMGTATASDQGLTTDGQPRPPGILNILSGRTSPKESYFHKAILDRKQDLTMRSVIVPDMSLHLDEMGLPKKGAMKIFRPFVVKEMVAMGYTPLQAREEIEKDTSLANKALAVVASKRPVLFKRDPVLHKFGIMAFKARIIDDEKAIHIHPLVVGGFNADFDGDAMGVFVPISQASVDEAYKMMPSKNLFNPSTGKVMYQPSLEGQLGLFMLTQFGKRSREKFASNKDAIDAANKGDIAMTDVVTVDGKKTTAGRLKIAGALPASLRTSELLEDADFTLNHKRLQGVLRGLATDHPAQFANSVDKLKDLGFGFAYSSGFSFDSDDFNTLSTIRDKHLKVAQIREKVVRGAGGTRKEQDGKVVALYQKATADIKTDAEKYLQATGNRLYTMYKAGVKPGWSQLQQLIIAPLLMENADGRIIPVPVTKSYAEGLSTAGYWTASSGARKGLIEKVQSVSEPGALSKQIVNTAIPQVITVDDCETTTGIHMKIGDRDLVDRFLVKGVKAKGQSFRAGSLITPQMVTSLKAARVDGLVVRSPTKCESPLGMCSKCYGAMDGGGPIALGTNIGVIAGQAIGEVGTQLSMRVFHTGGASGAGGSSVVGGIQRVKQLLKIPQTLPGKATLAQVPGRIGKVAKSAVGGYDVTIGGDEHYVPHGRELQFKVGDTVKKGDAISSGPVDPRELLELTNLDRVQRYLTDEVHGVYADAGVKKRNVEVVVRALTNLGVVEDPGEVGDEEGIIRNDYVSLTKVNALNRANKGKESVKVVPVLRGVETLALDQTTDWIARLQYRKLKETFTRAANEGWKSDIHGVHPAPGSAYTAEFGKPDSGSKSPY